jgi:hypothetical protein
MGNSEGDQMVEESVMARRWKKSRRGVVHRTRRWIQRALGGKAKRRKHAGLLHRMLGVPKGEKIPIKKLRRAAKAKGVLGRRARFALNMHKARVKRRRRG